MNKRNLLLLLPFLFLSGCFTKQTTIGHDFDLNLAEKIQIGKTTKIEILDLFGETDSVKKITDDIEILRFLYGDIKVNYGTLLIVDFSKTDIYKKDLTVFLQNDIVKKIHFEEGPIEIENYNEFIKSSKFKVKPPKKEAWFILKKMNDGITFARKNTYSNNSVILFYQFLKTDENIETNEDFKKFVINHVSLDSETSRFTETDYKIKKSKYKSYDSFVVTGTTIDTKKASNKKLHQKLYIKNIYVKYPKENNTLMLMGYSQRLDLNANVIDCDTEINHSIESFEYM